MLITSITLQDASRASRTTCALLVEGEVYWPLTDFFREKNFSVESERAYALAISRLMEWLGAKNKNSLLDPSKPSFTQLTFNSFIHDFRFGTTTSDGDAMDLWWKPASSQSVKNTAQRIAEFSDWLAAYHFTTPINPKDRLANLSERLVAVKHFSIKKSLSVLSHTKSLQAAVANSKTIRRIAIPGQKDSKVANIIAAFPSERIDDLLWKGFINDKFKDDPRPWMKWNLRDMLITLICLYGGCRESEPLHLWVDDVFSDPSDPESSLVLIHEPERGLAEFINPITGKPSHTTRLDFLKRFCSDKKPLTMETGRRHAGWKGCLLTDRKRQAFQVFWIDQEAGRLFNRLWSIYIKHSRPVQPKTPWAFLTKDGQPMGSLAFIDSFQRAVAKIGLESSKWNGTTPHGLRHRYGQWLNELGIDEKHGQICMHHTSKLSQEVYRTLGPASITDQLNAAQDLHKLKLVAPMPLCEKLGSGQKTLPLLPFGDVYGH